MTTLPEPPAGTVREYHTMDDGVQVYSWHCADNEDGSGGHADMWQPGIGWIVASPGTQAHFIGWDRDPDITPISVEEAEAYAPNAGYTPENLAITKHEGGFEICQAIEG